ncbi:MAG TPA: universal stress protein [Longimicrobiales bacterium]|nr:universal stress protein [Longimicrobiales bacterium]
MIDRILVPLDGSTEAEAVIPVTLGLARAFGSEVILLRVVEGEHHAGAPWTDPLEWRLARTEAMRYLRDVKPRFGDAAASVDLDVGAGAAAEEILEAVRARAADLLVITSHGRGGASAFPMAGTAHKIASMAEVSLVVVPCGEVETSDTTGPVLVPIDGSQRSEWALRVASALTRSSGAELVALHVVRTPEVLPVPGVEEVKRFSDDYVRAGTAAAQRYLDDAVARLVAEDVPHRTRVATGSSVPRTIEDVAEEELASLVVLCAHGRSAEEGCPFGTVAGGFLSRARRPLFLLQDRPVREGEARARWSAAGRPAQPPRSPGSSRRGIHR